MKTILCPTDFSAASENALHYAFELNKHWQAKLILMYSYFIPVPATDLPAFVPNPVEVHKEAMGNLQRLKEKMLKVHPASPREVELIATEGTLITEIKSIQEKQKIDLIITGTKGAHGLKRTFVGSNSASIIVNTDCPVITVPEKATYHAFRKIVFATNYAEGDFENIERVIDLAKSFNAEVIMLHIATGGRDKTSEFNSIEHFKQRIKEDSGYPNITFKLIEGKDVEAGILDYLDEIKADLIAMTNRHRNFFSRLFEKSLTRQMAFDTNKPLMAFHVEHEELKTESR